MLLLGGLLATRRTDGHFTLLLPLSSTPFPEILIMQAATSYPATTGKLASVDTVDWHVGALALPSVLAWHLGLLY